MRFRLGIVVAALATMGVIVGFFVTRFLNPTPAPIVATSTVTALQGRPVVNVELTTVGAIGSGPHPNWVAYLPTTYIDVPPGAVVHMTIIQEDSATGVRNPYFGLTRGTIDNQMTVNGKVFKALDPSLPAHTFTIPDLGINVPLDGLGSNASANARNIITFDFIVPNHKGVFRWQCFVPCAAGTLYGNGGPMQTLGYMAGELQVG
jgi:hypothetical protein